MNNNLTSSLSPAAAQEASGAVITERNASLSRAGIGAAIIAATVLGSMAVGAALPAGVILYLYAPAAALCLFAGARALGEYANVRKLDSLRHNFRSANLEDPMTRRNARLSKMGRWARIGGITLLVGGAIGFLTGGLALGAEVVIAAAACETARQFFSGGMRSAAKLDKEIQDIRDNDAMITPLGSGGKFRAAGVTPGFNGAAGAEAEPTVETEQVISIRRPLQLKHPAAAVAE